MLHLALEGANIAAMQGLQPYLQASGSQGLPNNLLRPHPCLQGEIALQSSFRYSLHLIVSLVMLVGERTLQDVTHIVQPVKTSAARS